MEKQIDPSKLDRDNRKNYNKIDNASGKVIQENVTITEWDAWNIVQGDNISFHYELVKNKQTKD